MAVVLGSIPEAVRQFTGGVLSVAQLEVNDRCNCGSVKISGGLVAHEVGHALGFWHVANDRNVMYDTIPSGVPGGEPDRRRALPRGVGLPAAARQP